MTRLAILEYPDPRLRARAQLVRDFDARLARLVQDMFETLYAAQAIGLAAPQVNVPWQLITIDVSGAGTAPEVYINPQILARSRWGMVEESCLSLPGISGLVKRPTALRVRALDRDGTPFTRDLDGMAAVCLGHEIDHLSGRLFIDSLSLWRRLRLRRAGVRSTPAVPGSSSHAPAVAFAADAPAAHGALRSDAVPFDPFQPAKVKR